MTLAGDANDTRGRRQCHSHTHMHPSSFLPAVANSDATALHDAAEWGFRETCLELLLAGAPLHALDGYQCTPRQRAEFRMVI